MFMKGRHDVYKRSRPTKRVRRKCKRHREYGHGTSTRTMQMLFMQPTMQRWEGSTEKAER